MAYEKQIQLLERLVERTRESEIEWKSSPEDGVFQFVIRKNTVRLRKVSNPGNSPLFELEMLDSSGELVDSFNDGKLDQEVFGRPDQKYFKMMRDLYETARRQALGADKILNEILRDLE